MQYKKTHSKNSLFLIEMLFSLLILSIACAACIRIFAAAGISRQKARELNDIQELLISAGEMTEGWDGDLASAEALLPGGNFSDGLGTYYYDDKWNICGEQNASYRMELSLSASQQKKTAGLCFFSKSGEVLYQTELSFPYFSGGKEVEP